MLSDLRFAAVPASRSAYGDRDARPQKIVSASVASALHLGILLLFLWLGRGAPPMLHSAERDVTVFDLTPSRAPPMPTAEVPPGPPRQEAQAASPPPPAYRQTEIVPPPILPELALLTPKAQAAPVDQSAQPPRPDKMRDNGAAEQTAPATAAPSDMGSRTAAAPRLAASASAQNAMASWQAELLAHLKRHRRYPRQAESARQQGVVLMRITLERSGRLVRAAIERPSGYPMLDMEALATVRRASPLPPPGPDISGDPVTVDVPILFTLR